MKMRRRQVVAGVALSLAAGLPGLTDAAPRPLPRLRAAANRHGLETTDGRPFFWLADTAWDLAYRTTPAEARHYLDRRAQQGFNVVQFVVLAESSDLSTPTDMGLLPLRSLDPLQPEPRFLDHVAWLVEQAARRGLYVALLPCWGDKVTGPWGIGPALFRTDNLAVAQGYARILARRLAGHGNVVFMLGGDRPAQLAPGPRDWWARKAAADAGWPAEMDWRPIWRAMAAGLIEGARDAGAVRPLIAYHPQGGPESTSVLLPDEPWLDLHAIQSGHGGGRDSPASRWIARDYGLASPKPVIDLEINYEDHPVNPWPVWNPANGYFRDLDVRAQAYRTVFAGAAGVTYGHHAVWQFAGPRHPGINHADRDWMAALDRPGAWQMRHLRRLIEARPADRVPASELIRDNGTGSLRAEAIRGAGWLLAYVPAAARAIRLATVRLDFSGAGARWFDPRTGRYRPAAAPSDDVFVKPGEGDWVLAIDDPRTSGSGSSAGRDWTMPVQMI